MVLPLRFIAAACLPPLSTTPLTTPESTVCSYLCQDIGRRRKELDVQIKKNARERERRMIDYKQLTNTCTHRTLWDSDDMLDTLEDLYYDARVEIRTILDTPEILIHSPHIDQLAEVFRHCLVHTGGMPQPTDPKILRATMIGLKITFELIFRPEDFDRNCASDNEKSLFDTIKRYRDICNDSLDLINPCFFPDHRASLSEIKKIDAEMLKLHGEWKYLGKAARRLNATRHKYVPRIVAPADPLTGELVMSLDTLEFQVF